MLPLDATGEGVVFSSRLYLIFCTNSALVVSEGLVSWCNFQVHKKTTWLYQKTTSSLKFQKISRETHPRDVIVLIRQVHLLHSANRVLSTVLVHPLPVPKQHVLHWEVIHDTLESYIPLDVWHETFLVWIILLSFLNIRKCFIINIKCEHFPFSCCRWNCSPSSSWQHSPWGSGQTPSADPRRCLPGWGCWSLRESWDWWFNSMFDLCIFVMGMKVDLE